MSSKKAANSLEFKKYISRSRVWGSEQITASSGCFKNSVVWMMWARGQAVLWMQELYCHERLCNTPKLSHSHSIKFPTNPAITSQAGIKTMLYSLLVKSREEGGVCKPTRAEICSGQGHALWVWDFICGLIQALKATGNTGTECCWSGSMVWSLQEKIQSRDSTKASWGLGEEI